MRLRNAIIWGLVLSAIACVAFLALTPPSDDFNIANPYWNGLSSMATDLDLQAMPSTGFEGMVPGSSAVLIIGPDRWASDEFVPAARSFVQEGGVIVIMDDFGFGDSIIKALLQEAGLSASFRQEWLADPLYMYRSQYYPKVETAAGEVVMDFGTMLTDLSGDYVILANSSAFSYMDMNRNGKYDNLEPVGPFPVAASFSYGDGKIVAVADPSMAINSLYGLEGNTAFIASIVGNRTAYLDTGHRSPTVLTEARSAVTGALSSFYIPEVRYLTALAGILAVFAVDWDRKAFRWSRGNRVGMDAAGEELERAAEEHPDWDRAALARIAKERRRNAGEGAL